MFFQPHPRRVLLVDDDSAFLELIQCMLELEPACVVVGSAHDGVEGVQLARALKPDVVVMDLQMPRMDGFQATREITDALGATRVLVVSSSRDPADVDRALDAGAAAYLPKDLAVNLLAAEVRRVADSVRQTERRAQRAAFDRDKACVARAAPITALLRPSA